MAELVDALDSKSSGQQALELESLIRHQKWVIMKEVEIITAQTSGFFGTQLIMIFGFILLLYFLLIRLQNKRLKAHQELVNNLEIGDEVITSGGIVCTLVKLSDTYVIARTGNNQEIAIQRQQINSVLPKGTVKSLFE